MQVRPGNLTDLDFLKEMLFEAFLWNESSKRPVFASFRDTSEFSGIALAGRAMIGHAT